MALKHLPNLTVVLCFMHSDFIDLFSAMSQVPLSTQHGEVRHKFINWAQWTDSSPSPKQTIYQLCDYRFAMCCVTMDMFMVFSGVLIV